MKFQKSKEINKLQVEVRHPSEIMMRATDKTMGHELTMHLKPVRIVH